MQLVIWMTEEAAASLATVLGRAGCRLEKIHNHYSCFLPDNSEGEQLAEWIMEATQLTDGVECAYVKPLADVADWKVVVE